MGGGCRPQHGQGHLLSLVLQLAQDLRLVPREQVLRARFAAGVLHTHGLVVGEAVDVARPAVAKLALRNEKTGEMVVGYGSDLLFMRSCDILCIG